MLRTRLRLSGEERDKVGLRPVRVAQSCRPVITPRSIRKQFPPHASIPCQSLDDFFKSLSIKELPVRFDGRHLIEMLGLKRECDDIGGVALT
jgi:hypothetical protein